MLTTEIQQDTHTGPVTLTTVNMPLDGKVYEQELRKLIASSRAKKSAPTVSTARATRPKASRSRKLGLFSQSEFSTN